MLVGSLYSETSFAGAEGVQEHAYSGNPKESEYLSLKVSSDICTSSSMIS